MNLTDQVTIVLHTRNRPRFLIPLVTHYAQEAGGRALKLLVLDGSEDDCFREIESAIVRAHYGTKVELYHARPGVSMTERLWHGIQRVTTPYVMLAADDDLYFFDWIDEGIATLEREPEFGVIYGHVLRFYLEGGQPLSRVVSAEYETRRNPPFRWLEDDRMDQRLAELGRSDWATAGWYALQRTSLLRSIVGAANRARLEGQHFERFLVLCQAALTKTRKLDRVFLARQNSFDEREPNGLEGSEEMFCRMRSAAIALTAEQTAVDPARVGRLVDSALAFEVKALRRNDRRKLTRSIGGRIPALRKAKHWTQERLRKLGFAPDPHAPDSRFPQPPTVSAKDPFVLQLRSYIESPRFSGRTT